MRHVIAADPNHLVAISVLEWIEQGGRLANVEPERCIQAFAGDAAVQRDLADVHLKVREGGPAELKRMLGRDAGYCDLSRVG